MRFRRRATGHQTHFGIRVEFRAPNGWTGHYAFSVGAQKRGGFEVVDEECALDSPSIFVIVLIHSRSFFDSECTMVNSTARGCPWDPPHAIDSTYRSL